MTTHVLIICTHNSARSVLGEGMLNHLASQLGKDVKAHSAGSAPRGRLNPFAIEALNHADIDTSGYRSKNRNEFTKPDAPPLSIVITVCDSAAAETHPMPKAAMKASAALLNSPVRRLATRCCNCSPCRSMR